MNYFSLLPLEIWPLTFNYLQIKQFINLYSTCKQFDAILDNYDWDTYFIYWLYINNINIRINKDFMKMHGAIILNNNCHGASRYLFYHDKLFPVLKSLLEDKSDFTSGNIGINFVDYDNKVIKQGRQYELNKYGILVYDYGIIPGCFKWEYVFKTDVIFNSYWPILLSSLKMSLLYFPGTHINISCQDNIIQSWDYDNNY